MEYNIKPDNVKIIGRTTVIEDTLWCGLSGSGISFMATGTRIAVTIVGDDSTYGNITEGPARVAFYADGKRVVDMMVEQPETEIEVFRSEQTQTVQIEVIKLSECAMSTLGIKNVIVEDSITNEVIINPTKHKTHSIEFIGDSITCGYGIDLEIADTPFYTKTEDVTKAYAYRTAQRLDADYSMCSYSGYGIISGYTDNGQPLLTQILPDYYEKVGFSFGHPLGTVKLADLQWNFKTFQPELIVVNLGTNDDSYCQDDVKRQQQFTKKYEVFLEVVQKNNPQAYLLCTIGTMCQRIAGAVEEAVKLYKMQTSDTRISYYRLPLQLPEDGLVSSGHPTVVSHEKAAKLLSEEIKRIWNN